MKRRHRAAAACGLLIQIPLAQWSHAATLAVNATTGNLVVTAADSGANTIDASGGTNPAPYTITVDPGVILTGDAVTQLGVNVTKTGYTIQNNGSLSGALDGIRATTTGVVVTVVNTGIITGGTVSGNAGINALSGTVTSSAGAISGFTGVLFPSTGTSADTLTLTGGTLTGTGGTAASLGGGNDIFNLYGTASVTGNILLGGNDDTAVIGGGTLNGTLNAEGGNDNITLNSGTILGTITAGVGDDTVTLNGGILTGAISGTTQTAVGLGGGNDTIHIHGGTITGTLSGEAGNDTFNFASGSSLSGVINGGTETDIVNFSGNVLVQGAFNAITFIETLNKNGTGTTTVNGATQMNTINLNQGSLFLNGNISPTTTGGIVTLNSAGTHLGGTLSGASGVWNVDLQHTAGNFSPGSTLPAGGVATATATLALTTATFNGGSLLIHSNPLTGSNDLLKITGNLNLNSTPLIISPVTREAPLSTMTVVDVTGTTSGTFLPPVILIDDGISPPTPFTPSTFTIQALPGTADPNDIVIEVVHHYDTLPGLSAFGTGMAQMLNAATAGAASDPELARFLGALDYSGGPASAMAINALEPDGYLESQLAAVHASTLIHRIVESQNDAARSTRNFNRAWGNYNLSDQEGIAHQFTAGFGGGSMIDRTNFGALVSHMMMDDWYGSKSSLSTTTLGVYLGTGELVGWQWNAFLGYTEVDGEFLTRGTGGGLFPQGKMTPEGDGWQFLLSGGYVIQEDRLSWGPTFGLEYSTFDFDPTACVRGGGLPTLSVDSSTVESLRLLLGAKFEYDLPGSSTPYFAVQYVSELMGDVSGYSVGAGGASFYVPQPMGLSDDAILLRAGIMHRFNQHWQGNFGYLGQLGLDSKGTDSHTLNLGVMANF